MKNLEPFVNAKGHQLSSVDGLSGGFGLL